MRRGEEEEEIEAAVRNLADDQRGFAQVMLSTMHQLFDQLERNLMSSFAELVQADADLATEVGVIITTVTAQTATIADLQNQISNAGLPAAQQAQLDATVADLKAQHDQIAAAIPAVPVVAPTEPAPVDPNAPAPGA